MTHSSGAENDDGGEEGVTGAPTPAAEFGPSAEAAAAAEKKSVSPWGVQLKKTPRGRNPVPNTRGGLRRLKEDTAKAEDGLRQTRTSLRKVANLPPRQKNMRRSGGRHYSRPSSRGWKLRQTNSPLLGVVLRKLDTIQEEEEYLDLDLMAAVGKNREEKKPKDKKGSDSLDCSHHAASSHGTGTTKTSTANNSFGVRLKPNRRRTAGGQKDKQRRTYQIDLNPILEEEGASFNIVSQSKSFLEVKLRPITARQGNQDSEINPVHSKAVELQLRHVVAPADGGPRRTVTEAVFQVPLLKPIPPPEERKHWKLPTSDDPIQDLLQICLQNLKATDQDLPDENQALQIQLKQVDPETQEVTTMDHVIDIALKQNQATKDTDDVASWAMDVQIQNICPHLDPPAPPTPSCALCAITICQPINPNEPQKERIILRHVKRTIEDPNFVRAEAEEMEDDSNYYDWDDSQYDHEDGNSSRTDSNPELDDDDEEEELLLPMPDDSQLSQLLQPSPDKEDTSSGSSSSSSSSSGDSFGGGDEEEEEEPAAAQPQPEPEPPQLSPEETKKINDQKRRDLLMWYSRMRSPTKAQMKQKVLQLPKSCDIKPEDVDQLPWLPGGMFLDLKVMNQMFLDGWQGADTNNSTNTNGKSEEGK